MHNSDVWPHTNSRAASSQVPIQCPSNWRLLSLIPDCMSYILNFVLHFGGNTYSHAYHVNVKLALFSTHMQYVVDYQGNDKVCVTLSELRPAFPGLQWLINFQYLLPWLFCWIITLWNYLRMTKHYCDFWSRMQLADPWNVWEHSESLPWITKSRSLSRFKFLRNYIKIGK